MSAYPTWLTEIIQIATDDIGEYGYVSPETRLAIYDHLDPMNSNPPNIHAARGRLALNALNKVLPVWQRHLPILADEDDQFPMQLVEKIKDVIEGRANLPEMWAYANDHWYVSTNVIDEIFEFHDDIPNTVAYVVETAIKALLESMGLETLKEVEVWSEDDHARFTDDAAATAAIVLCGGGDTGIDVDYGLLEDYWHWWLTEAVPNAWKGGAF